MRTHLVMAASVLSQALASSAFSASYIGVYADAEGTQPCASVAPYTAKTFYVIAKLDGAMSGGLTGAEFRIEFGNPTGWLASYTAPSTANIVSGDPIDTDPDPNAGGGINLAFPSCETPLSGMVNLGTLSVFNVSGTPTSLQVKRHSSPSNTTFTCPLFVLCDDPVFSKLCMSAGEAATCSTITVPKVIRPTATDDAAVFELTLNNSALTASPEPAFEDTLTVRSGNELWVMGEPISMPVIPCSFDGSVLSVGGVVIHQILAPPLDNGQLMTLYADVPRVAACMATGMSFDQAVAVFRSEIDALEVQARVAHNIGQNQAMLQVLTDSPLVDEIIETIDTTVLVRLKGISAPFGVSGASSLQDRPLTPRQAAIHTLRSVRNAVQRAGAGLVSVTGVGVSSFGGASPSARSQLEYVRRTGTTSGLPAGPLRPQSQEVISILQTGKRGDGR